MFFNTRGWDIDTLTWWRHQMETFSALLALCEGILPVTGGSPSQRPVTRNFDAWCDLCLNKRLSKQSRHRWFETPSHPLWRHYNESPQRDCHRIESLWSPCELYLRRRKHEVTFWNAMFSSYRKISNISRTESSTLTVSRLVLQLSFPNPMKPGVKSRMKM